MWRRLAWPGALGALRCVLGIGDRSATSSTSPTHGEQRQRRAARLRKLVTRGKHLAVAGATIVATAAAWPIVEQRFWPGNVEIELKRTASDQWKVKIVSRRRSTIRKEDFGELTIWPRSGSLIAATPICGSYSQVEGGLEFACAGSAQLTSGGAQGSDNLEPAENVGSRALRLKPSNINPNDELAVRAITLDVRSCEDWAVRNSLAEVDLETACASEPEMEVEIVRRSLREAIMARGQAASSICASRAALPRQALSLLMFEFVDGHGMLVPAGWQARHGRLLDAIASFAETRGIALFVGVGSEGSEAYRLPIARGLAAAVVDEFRAEVHQAAWEVQAYAAEDDSQLEELADSVSIYDVASDRGDFSLGTQPPRTAVYVALLPCEG